MYYAGEFQDGINNMSYDDLTYETMTIGYKSNNWKTKKYDFERSFFEYYKTRK